MTDLFEKSINLGLGLFMYSRERVEDFVDELVNKGDIAKKDARQFAGELIQKGEEQREELKKLIKDEVEKALNYANVAKKEDLVSKDEIRDVVREQIKEALKEHDQLKSEPK